MEFRAAVGSQVTKRHPLPLGRCPCSGCWWMHSGLSLQGGAASLRGQLGPWETMEVQCWSSSALASPAAWYPCWASALSWHPRCSPFRTLLCPVFSLPCFPSPGDLPGIYCTRYINSGRCAGQTGATSFPLWTSVLACKTGKTH